MLDDTFERINVMPRRLFKLESIIERFDLLRREGADLIVVALIT
jgi:hypothetical protein